MSDCYVIRSLTTLMAQNERMLSESVAMREHLMALVANLCRVEIEMRRLAKQKDDTLSTKPLNEIVYCDDNLRTYRVFWSGEDREYVGICDQYPSASHLAKDRDGALSGIRALVAGFGCGA